MSSSGPDRPRLCSTCPMTRPPDAPGRPHERILQDFRVEGLPLLVEDRWRLDGDERERSLGRLESVIHAFADPEAIACDHAVSDVTPCQDVEISGPRCS